MITIKLRIHGFLSYLEQVELEFDRFDLACISGSNGAGKSSLLDAITWVLFGEARRRDDAVINSRADFAEVVLDFAYEGSTYRVQRIKRREKATQLEFYIQTADGDWKALTEHSVTETEKRINETLRMDYDTFINASFFLQGKADEFARKNPTQRKLILSSILGLEMWDEYRKRAEIQRKRLENKLSGIVGSIEEIEKELGEEDTRKSDLAQKEEMLKLAGTALKEKRKSFDTNRNLQSRLDAQFATVKVLQGQFEGSAEKLDELREKIARLSDQKANLEVILRDEENIEKEYSAWQAADRKLKEYEKLALDYRPLYDEWQKATSRISMERTRLDAEQKSLQASEKKMKALMDSMPAQEQRVESIKKEVESLENEIKHKEKLETEERTTLEGIASGSKHIQQLDGEIEKIEKRIASLAESSEANCPTCGQPLTAGHREKVLSEMNEEKGQKDSQKNSIFREVEGLHNRQKELAGEKAKIKSAEEALKRNHDDLARQETMVAGNRKLVDDWVNGDQKHLQEVNQKLKDETFLAEDRLKILDLQQKIDKLGYDEKAHKDLRLDAQNLAGWDEQKRELEKARSALEPVSRELSESQTGEAGLILETKKNKEEFEKSRDQYESGKASLPNMQAEEKELNELDAREKFLRGEVGAARQKVDVLDSLRANKHEHESEIKVIRSQIATMKQLEKAFGKDGIPAMLIEDALPSIQERANDILDRLSSGAMSVRFETQKDMKTRDEKKETLDIVISDGAGQRAYEMYSGGEAFRVNFAIRLALSHLLAQRAGARLQTLVIDEGFGSQDTDGRQKLIEAINLVKPDYAKILVITHLEELKDAFPARIEVEKTSQGSQVKVITA